MRTQTRKIEMGKAAVGVACFFISFLYSCNELFAQANNQPLKTEAIIITPMKALSSNLKIPAPASQPALIKTVEFKKIKEQYAKLIMLKPDTEMAQLTLDEQVKADLEMQKITQTRQKNIVKVSEKLSDQYQLAALTYNDLKEVTPSAQQADVAVVVSPQYNNSAQNTSVEKLPVVSDNRNDFSQPVASAQQTSGGDGSSVSLRRSSGFLQNKSKLEQKYILSYKIHENEGQ